MKKSRTVSSNIPKLSLSLLTNPNLFLQEYSIPSIQATNSKEFVLLCWVRTGHKREFAFAMKAQSEICGYQNRLRYLEAKNSD
nr:hypothetical protein CFP56_22098 [Quercus suber]